jgi:hypothetical protein
MVRLKDPEVNSAMKQEHPIVRIRRRKRTTGHLLCNTPLSTAWIKPFRAQICCEDSGTKRYFASNR